MGRKPEKPHGLDGVGFIEAPSAEVHGSKVCPGGGMPLCGGRLKPFDSFAGVGCHDGTGDIYGAQSVLGIGVPAFGLFCHCPQDGLMSGIFLLRQRWQGDQKSVATTSAALKAERNIPPVLPERNLATLGSRKSRS